MLEIVRDRSWTQAHSFFDDDGVTPSDLTGYTFVCQIRKAVATRNSAGIFEHELVVDVDVAVADNVTTWSLTRAKATALSPTDKYIIDMVGTKADLDESFIDPEPIKVVNRPSQP